MNNFLKYLNAEIIIAITVIFIITFPQLNPVFSIGLDTSYVWAYNYLFNNNYQLLTNLVYPYGPLGFLKMPVEEANNLKYFLIFYSIIKIWFSILFISLTDKNKVNNRIIAYITLFVILLIFNSLIDFIIAGIVFIHIYYYLKNNKLPHIIAAVVLAFIGISIKSSVGVSAFSIIFVGFIIDTLKYKNLKKSLNFIIVALLSLIIIGVSVFQGIVEMFIYLINVLRFSISYSSALAIFPDNNWILLSLFLASILIIPFLIKEKNIKTAFLLMLPVFFASWKHAMTRQDMSHIMHMIWFLFLFWGILLIISEKNKKIILLLSVLSLTFFYSNSKTVWNFAPFKTEIIRINNFESTILNLDSFRKDAINRSKSNIAAVKFDDNIKEIIGDNSIDSYPWELSYFAANNVNWQPRRTLQSGSYARWLDKLIAEDFDRNNGPRFIIMHYLKDNWSGNFGSIDERYLLNDNPQTIKNIFNYYDVVKNTQDFILLEKNKSNNIINVIDEEPGITQWNDWIEVNYEDGEILRIKIKTRQTFAGKLKNFFYKSEPYYVDYMFEDSTVLSYRFIPENAADGIWIEPFIRYPETEFVEKSVISLRFRCTYKKLNKKNIEYAFQRMIIDKSKYPKTHEFNSASKLFGKIKYREKQAVVRILYDYDQFPPIINVDDELTGSYYFTGIYSGNIEPGAYSYTLEINMDSLWSKLDDQITDLIIDSGFEYFNMNSRADHVISLSGSAGKDFWNGKQLKINADKNIEHYSYANVKLNRGEHESGILKIYVWNSGNNKLEINNHRIIINAFGTKNK